MKITVNLSAPFFYLALRRIAGIPENMQRPDYTTHALQCTRDRIFHAPGDFTGSKKNTWKIYVPDHARALCGARPVGTSTPGRWSDTPENDLTCEKCLKCEAQAELYIDEVYQIVAPLLIGKKP